MKKSNTSVINLKSIVKSYGTGSAKVHALNKVDISIKKGEFVAIMGRSGSGKSTMMNIIGLLDRHFGGTYELEGKKVSQLSESDTAEIRSKEIGFVFQQFNLLKKTSVLENVLLPTIYSPAVDDELRAIEIIKLVGLGDRIHNKSNQLSGGQIQRVAIARALVMNPAIILADEPTGNLDSNTAHEVMSLLQEINEKGKTIVLITHEDDIAAYADRTITLLDGKIEQKTINSDKTKRQK
jgi:putative ABC transport system ATP-binding protein